MANLRTLGEACHNLRIICVFLVPFITFFEDTTCHYCNDSLRKRRSAQIICRKSCLAAQKYVHL